ncbi:hypothetical protein E2C01_015062 [Portunus trituberculatus]|uniref:Uncharacterized protein n=1 Tax=Portunus trituberculatus TaxID=210409 RepID=A0A5B7DM54_PORTR|nr:hypothetical protein [Portunus trituberculatus]
MTAAMKKDGKKEKTEIEWIVTDCVEASERIIEAEKELLRKCAIRISTIKLALDIDALLVWLRIGIPSCHVCKDEESMEYKRLRRNIE